MFYQQAQKNIVIMKGKKDICETLMQPSFGHKFQDVQAFKLWQYCANEIDILNLESRGSFRGTI